MQLLIILALLLYGGKADAANTLSEIKPVLESVGGEDMREALKSAEEISSVLSAVREISSAGATASAAMPAQADIAPRGGVNFPLAPVSAIADKDITYSLSKYIAQNA